MNEKTFIEQRQTFLESQKSFLNEQLNAFYEQSCVPNDQPDLLQEPWTWWSETD